MSITSKTDICNLSLDLLSGAVIQDVDNPSTSTEELCSRWYDVCRKATLREHPWTFARKRAILAASATAPLFGYTKAYPFPNDYIRFLTIENDEGMQINNTDFEIENNAVLLSSDATSVRLRYIYDVTDVTKFDALFVNYFALNLALMVAFKITESNTNVDRIAQLQKQQGAMSRAISGQERQPIRIVNSKNRDARLSQSSATPHRIIF